MTYRCADRRLRYSDSLRRAAKVAGIGRTPYPSRDAASRGGLDRRERIAPRYERRVLVVERTGLEAEGLNRRPLQGRSTAGVTVLRQDT
jgi:hypothetical protein